MGRRSRKRGQDGASSDPGAEAPGRAARDAARRDRAREARVKTGSGRPGGNRPPGRRRTGDRPPPLWGAFPLTELVTLAGIILMAWGFLEGAEGGGNRKIAAGLAIASIAGLELAIREHLTGFRSHTTLLSGATAIITILVLGLGAGLATLGILLLAALLAFAGAFIGLRELFKRRSGGLSFR